MVYNQKLLHILERVELDRPILMRDKLEIIWEQKPKKPQPETQKNIEDGIDLDEDDYSPLLDDLEIKNPIKKKKPKIVNEQGLKRELELRKLERQNMNQR